MRGLVAVSIKQSESSPSRKEGREVLAGQYLDKAEEANVLVVIVSNSEVVVETLLVFDTMPSIWTHHS